MVYQEAKEVDALTICIYKFDQSQKSLVFHERRWSILGTLAQTLNVSR